MKLRFQAKANDESVILSMKIIDVICVASSGLVAYLILNDGEAPQSFYYQALIIAGGLSPFIFQSASFYESWRGRSMLSHFRAIGSGISALMVLLVVIAAVTKTTSWFSRYWFAAWAGLMFFELFSVKRLTLYAVSRLRKQGWNQRGIVIYGEGEVSDYVRNTIETAEETGFEIVTTIDSAEDRMLSQHTDDHLAQSRLELRGIAALAESVRSKSVKEVWLALPMQSADLAQRVVYALRHSTVTVRFIPDVFIFSLLVGRSVTEIAGIPMVNFNADPITGSDRILKELEDRVLAFLILIFISPILLLVAIAIKLESRGPVLYKQERHGWEGKVIKVYKFRSMHVIEGSHEFKQATKNDARLTRVGAWIRKTSLDELPQFFNVLQGRMSIVGPRPHAVQQNNFYLDKVEHYFQRHKVKPGITGLAQINGWRGETDTLDKMKGRIEYDLQYIQNWSIWLDFKIIALTVFRVFKDKNAY